MAKCSKTTIWKLVLYMMYSIFLSITDKTLLGLVPSTCPISSSVVTHPYPTLLWYTGNLQTHLALSAVHISCYSFLLGLFSLCWSRKRTPGHYLWLRLNMISYRIFLYPWKMQMCLLLCPTKICTDFTNSNYLTLFYHNVYIYISLYFFVCNCSSIDNKALEGQNWIF